MAEKLRIKRQNVNGGRFVTIIELKDSGPRELTVLLKTENVVSDLRVSAQENRKKADFLNRQAELMERAATQLALSPSS